MISTAVRSDGRVPVGSGFDVDRVREDFPILRQVADGKPLIYLDNAATSQKPQATIDAVTKYYAEENANIHRGVYRLSERATAAYEGVREKVRRFINAADAHEIVFVRGTTEAVNLVAQSYGRANLDVGDEVLITAMEHHSNIVPWQMVCEEKKAQLRVAPMNQSGELLLDEFEKRLTERTKIVGVTHVSNALGTVNPIKEICRLAHARGIPVLVDGAQGAPHIDVDVRDLDCDFYTVSGHKMFGPTGIGVLYGKRALLEAMPPYQGGGDMILSVSFDRTEYAGVPTKFEAGTPNIGGVVGLGATIDYVNKLDWSAVEAYERDLLNYAGDRLMEIPGLTMYGTAAHKASVLSFTLEGVHAHDVGTIVDAEGVAIRTGHHCAQPVMDFYGVPATARASLALYNTRDDVDALVRSLHRVREVFA